MTDDSGMVVAWIVAALLIWPLALAVLWVTLR